jgi:hypothetical protein
MENSVVVLLGAAALAMAAPAAFALYRWLQRQRVHRVEKWVKEYLFARYGELPNHLNTDCSDDPLWPVVVAFEGPRTGNRHRLQFVCSGPSSTFCLLSEKEEVLTKGPLAG